MPWSNQSGGGGVPGGNAADRAAARAPGAPGPQGSGTPPDLEDILRRGQDRLKDFIPRRLDGRQGPDRPRARR